MGFYDIDTSVRINGGLTINGDSNIPSNSLNVGGTITGNVITGNTINAGTFNEGGVALSSKYLGINSTAVNSTQFNSLNSNQFVRSDTQTNISANIYFTSGNGVTFQTDSTDSAKIYTEYDNTIASGSTQTNLVLYVSDDGNDAIVHRVKYYGSGNATDVLTLNYNQAVFDSGVTLKVGSNVVWHAGNDGSGSGLDADKLDGLDSANFMKGVSANGFFGLAKGDGTTSDWIRTTVNGLIPYNSGNNSSLGTSSWNFNTIYGNTIYEGNTALSSKYLGINSTATNADKLDNIDSSSFLRSDQNDIMNGILTISGSSATPLVLQRTGGYLNSNMQFVHDSGNAYLGIDQNANLKFGTSNDLNANGYYIWHSNNDGSGSGLDADKLDGIDSTGFQLKESTIFTLQSANGYVAVRTASRASGNYYEFWDSQAGWADIKANDIYLSNGQYKAWHAGNDGSGSGLDADTIDSIQGSQIVNDTGITVIGQDWNTLTGNGIYRVGAYSGNNGPSANAYTGVYSYGTLEVIQTNNSVTQNYYSHSSGLNTGMWTRTKWNASDWTAWKKIWTDNNMGSGSGLDADKLDSLDSTQFLRSDIPTTLTGGNDLRLKATSGSTDSGDLVFQQGDGTENGRVYGGPNTLYLRAGNSPYGSLTVTTGNVTFNYNTIWHSGNMGAGSGLDADKLDGQDSSYYVYNGQNHLFNNMSGGASYDTVDFNTLKTIGEYRFINLGSSGTTNKPTGDNGYGYYFGMGGGDVGGRGFQLLGTSYKNMWFRELSNNTWCKIWNDQNDGSGSGLDADTLDGLDSLAFVKADGTVPMTGELVINRSSSHLQLQESAVNKWHMESVGGQLRFVETGIAQRLVLNTGNTGQMTWNGNTVWHAGNMGSGSGLDADKVDGIDSTTLRQGRNANYLNFTVNGDANTYYPVLVGGSAKYGFNTYSITRAYNWTAPSTWGQADGSHLGGLTFTFQWSGDTGWGGNDHNLRVVQFYETYTNMVGGFKLSTGGLIVYLRGGGAQYQLQTESGTSSTVTIYDGVSNASTSYTAPDSTVYAPRTDTSNVNSEVNAFFPVRNGGTLYVSNNVVWHSGNMGSGSHLDSDTVDGIQGSQFLRNDLSSQSVNTGFTMSANAYVGMSNSSGALYVRTGTGSLGIQLAGDNASQQAGVKVYMNASGNANFGGTVSANALVISSTSLVNNLNAQMLNGVKEPQIVKNQSIADISGKGVYAGCGVTAQAVPNMTAQVIAGTVYTDSGMRVSIGSSYNVSFSAPSATYNRIDSVYVQGSSAGANEGVVTVAQGTASATPVPPSIPSDGVLLANVTIRQNAGSILGTDITDMRMWKNLFNLNGDTYINNNLYVQSQLNSTLGYINMLKPIKNTPSNNSITISAGSTSYTWTHNLGLTNYIVKLSTNNPEPHIYWSNKTTNAITINLDDSYDTDTIVDIGIEAF